MRMHDVTYEAHNVLEDDDIREGIKEFSSWPTIPQVSQNKYMYISLTYDQSYWVCFEIVMIYDLE